MRLLVALALAALSLTACALDGLPYGAGAQPAPSTGSASSLQLYIAEPGLYRLTAADVRGAGMPVSADAVPRLQLLHRNIAIPLDVTQSGADFTVYFYASPAIGTYSSTDAYRLTLNDKPGARMTTRTVDRVTSAPAASFDDRMTVSEKRIYSASPIGGSHWFWLSVTSPLSAAVAVTLPETSASTGHLTVTIAGGTEGAHHVEFAINGEPLGEARWDGRTSHVFDGAASTLRSGTNTLSISGIGIGDQPEVDFLENVTVAFRRTYRAVGDQLAFTAEPGASVRATGFKSEPPVLYDVTDAMTPIRVTGFAAGRDENGANIEYTDSHGGRFLALAPASARKPASIRPVRDSLLRAGAQGADYVVIAPESFADALQPLLKFRGNHGLKTQLVDVEQVYDEFGDGVSTPYAIRDFMRFAQEHWHPAPRWLLLVGKASYDYRNFLKGPNQNVVPTFLTPALNLGEAASDNWFVAESDLSDHPVAAVGRIPAKTPEQVRLAVDKIIAYEQAAKADWQQRAVIVADDKDPSFAASAQMVVGLLPAGMTAQQIRLADFGGNPNVARTPLLRAWNEGAGLMTYIGHGSIDTWAAGPWFSVDHVGEVKNGSRLPILLTPTCLDGFFYHPQKDSLAEALLFKADGGMIGGLVPTGLSFPNAQDELMRGLFGELVGQAAPTVGEAIMNAKRKMADDRQEYREVIDTFVWLGDPALVNPFAVR